MELKVNEIQQLEPIKFNYEDLKANLTESLKKYKDLVYTEENIKEAKADRALLNKVSTAINDEKKRIKNILLQPYVDFEEKCKELMGMVNEVSEGIDTQVKAFEKRQADEKLKEIMKYFIENVGIYKDLIDFDLIFEDRWLNSSYSMKKIQTDINHIFEKTKMDLGTLDTTITDADINKQVKDYYFRNINNSSVLSMSIQEAKRIETIREELHTLENPQSITKSEENITNSSQNITKNVENVTESEELKQLDIRVWVTEQQKFELKEFLKNKNIKFGKVE
ncbi:MAG: DUF1351 domain-containing protein [Clostridia bacterium]|nr:DUF1351 domain-containing protein [Clostridia bacterium]